MLDRLNARINRNVNPRIAAILESFSSQTDRYWFTDETFRSLLRLRGVEARSQTGYAEAFYARKLIVDLSQETR